MELTNKIKTETSEFLELTPRVSSKSAILYENLSSFQVLNKQTKHTLLKKSSSPPFLTNKRKPN